jgi:hypothetical protein
MIFGVPGGDWKAAMSIFACSNYGDLTRFCHYGIKIESMPSKD